MIKVFNDVDVYEVNGKEPSGDVPKIRVLSHWNRNGFVILCVGDETVTVSAHDLEAAIRNATNSARF